MTVQGCNALNKRDDNKHEVKLYFDDIGIKESNKCIGVIWCLNHTVPDGLTDKCFSGDYVSNEYFLVDSSINPVGMSAVELLRVGRIVV